MNSIDTELLRNLRREFARRPVDITRLDIQVSQGRIIMAGQIAHLRDQPNVELRDEMAIIEKIFSRNPNCKSLTLQVRFVPKEADEKHEGGTRGRLRH